MSAEDSGWNYVPLSEVIEDAIGGLWGSPPDPQKDGETEVRVVRGADFRNWATQRAGGAAARRIPDKALARRELHPGDLVLEVSGGGPSQPVGRVLLVDERAVSETPFPLICSNFCRKLRLRNNVNPYFVKKQLDWLYRAGHTNEFQTSTTNIRNLQVDAYLAGTLIALPDRSTQDRVAPFLEELEERIANTTARIAAGARSLDRFRSAVLAAACAGELTTDWRSDHQEDESAQEIIERSRETLEASKTRRSKVEPWTQPDWIELPDTWSWAPLREVASIRGGIQKQPKRAPRKNAFPYLRVANVMRGRLDLSEIHEFELFEGELETYRLEPGDLLVVEGNGSASEIGRAALWNGQIPNCVHQNHIIRVRSVEVLPEFIELFWNSPIGAREVAALAVTSSGLYNLSTSKIGAVSIPVAPPAEQREIVRRAKELLTLAKTVELRLQGAARRVDETSFAILEETFKSPASV